MMGRSCQLDPLSRPTMSNPVIRLATEADLPAISKIHDHYVSKTTCTYALEPLSAEARHAWLTARPDIHPVTVAEQAGAIIAWGALGFFRLLAGYRSTVENSIYVHPDFLRQRLGSLILEDQMRRAGQLGLHSIIAVIDSQQAGSIRLHATHGFAEAGRFREVARKFEAYHDAVFMQWLVADSTP